MTWFSRRIGAGAGPLCQGRTVRVGWWRSGWAIEPLPGRGRPHRYARSPAELTQRGQHSPGVPQTCPFSDVCRRARDRTLYKATGSSAAVHAADWPRVRSRVSGRPGGKPEGPSRPVAAARPERAACRCAPLLARWLRSASLGRAGVTIDLAVLLWKGLTRCIAHWVLAGPIRASLALALLGRHARTARTDLLLELRAPRVAWWDPRKAWPHTVAAASRPRPAPPQPRSTEHFENSPGRQARCLVGLDRPILA